MEMALQQRTRQYNRDVRSLASDGFSPYLSGSAEDLRVFIRLVDLEELRCLRLLETPTLVSLAKVFKDEARLAMHRCSSTPS